VVISPHCGGAHSLLSLTLAYVQNQAQSPSKDRQTENRFLASVKERSHAEARARGWPTCMKSFGRPPEPRARFRRANSRPDGSGR
jgi:hypothetical protein